MHISTSSISADLSPLAFGVAYMDAKGTIFHAETVCALGYWEACETALRFPAHDFQIVEDPEAITKGSQAIREAAAGILRSRRETCGFQGEA